MITYASILLYAIPAFLGLIAIEYIISLRMKRVVVTSFDTISSLSSGLTNIIKDVLGIALVIISYEWLLDTFHMITFQSKLWHYVIAFIVLDFAGYWAHRWEHVINIFWNRHIIHHSSEEFNLACALRQNISAIVRLFTFLLLPAALIGIPAEVIAVIAPLHLFAQFWYHTRLIDKMGFLEYIIVTPSHHRVHHAINDQYLDKNYGQIFIVWDKLFGTFQEELSSVEPIYGVKRAVRTFNPIKINYQHFWLMLKDAWFTSNWKDKLLLWFKPTGYRPTDRLINDPVPTIEDPYAYEKFMPKVSQNYHIWAWIQFSIVIVFGLHFLYSFADYTFVDLVIYGLYIAALVYALTSMLDFNKDWVIGSCTSLIIVIGMVLFRGNWFGITPISILAITLIVGMGNFYFRKMETELSLK